MKAMEAREALIRPHGMLEKKRLALEPKGFCGFRADPEINKVWMVLAANFGWGGRKGDLACEKVKDVDSYICRGYASHPHKWG